MPTERQPASSPLALGSLLARDARLRHLAAAARQYLALRAALRGALPSEVAAHCLGGELQDGTLVVFFDTNTAAAIARYHQAGLLAAAGSRARALRVRVLPEAALPSPPTRPGRRLDEASRELLERTAQSLEAGALARSLRRLARK